ncbi:unnamed protein product, partial [Closterium sp. Naga37s-1]
LHSPWLRYEKAGLTGKGIHRAEREVHPAAEFLPPCVHPQALSPVPSLALFYLRPAYPHPLLPVLCPPSPSSALPLGPLYTALVEAIRPHPPSLIRPLNPSSFLSLLPVPPSNPPSHPQGPLYTALVEAIRPHLPSLRSSPYGKRILARTNLRPK